uniref:Phosphatase and actin regulator n=1 Tax=Paramormyrops kingsleyae TaxID=1676925 RepID=A0A3B3Q8C4_9TELE
LPPSPKALKSPAVFHERIRSLERARTENFLKQKIRSRPQRSELVRMHILQETAAEPSLQAAQMKLKRARLADDLNEKIAQRPGPMELVEKNILPVDCNVKEAISGEGCWEGALCLCSTGCWFKPHVISNKWHLLYRSETSIHVEVAQCLKH